MLSYKDETENEWSIYLSMYLSRDYVIIGGINFVSTNYKTWKRAGLNGTLKDLKKKNKNISLQSYFL